MTTAHANFNQNMKEHARIRIEQMKKKAFHIDWKKSARTNDYKFNLSTRSEANK